MALGGPPLSRHEPRQGNPNGRQQRRKHRALARVLGCGELQSKTLHHLHPKLPTNIPPRNLPRRGPAQRESRHARRQQVRPGAHHPANLTGSPRVGLSAHRLETPLRSRRRPPPGPLDGRTALAAPEQRRGILCPGEEPRCACMAWSARTTCWRPMRYSSCGSVSVTACKGSGWSGSARCTVSRLRRGRARWA